jgi:hypothetical protein
MTVTMTHDTDSGDARTDNDYTTGSSTEGDA